MTTTNSQKIQELITKYLADTAELCNKFQNDIISLEISESEVDSDIYLRQKMSGMLLTDVNHLIAIISILSMRNSLGESLVGDELSQA
jgi:hypothetical protein